MNPRKLKLMAKYPFLYKNEIKKLVREFQDSLHFDSVKLVEYFPDLLTDAFFSYIYEKCNFEIDDLDLNKLLRKLDYNKKFIDLIIKYQPSLCFKISPKALEEKHILYLEEYLTTKPIEYLDLSRLPSRLFKLQSVKDYILNLLNRGSVHLSLAVSILENYYDDGKFLNQIIENMQVEYIPVNTDSIKNSFIWNSDEILINLMKSNYRIILAVPAHKKNYALQIMAEMIRDGSFRFEEGIFYGREFNFIFQSKLITDAIMSLQDFKQYYDFLRMSTIDNFSEEQINKLVNVFEQEREFVFPKDYTSSSKILKIFLQKKELLQYLLYFPNESFTQENIEYICLNLSSNEIKRILNKLSDDNYFIHRLLIRCKNDILNNNYETISLLSILNQIQLSNEEDKKLFSEIINLYFRQKEYRDFKTNSFITHNYELVESLIKISTLEDFKLFFAEIQKSFDLSLAMIVIKNYKRCGLNDENLNQLCEYYLTRVKNSLALQFNDKSSAYLVVEKMLNGTRNSFSLNYIKSDAHLKVAAQFTDILSRKDAEKISTAHGTLYEFINKKHLKEIITLISNQFNVSSFQAFDLAIRMYGTIGYVHCRDLLSPNQEKNYGPVNYEKLNAIFSNISLDNVLLVQQGNNFVPVENQKLMTLMFGNNYKDKNAAIHHYLTNFSDLTIEMEKSIAKIENDSKLSAHQKKEKQEEVRAQFASLKENIEKFINRFSWAFDNWELIEEEYYKLLNVSKLPTKLNISFINAIAKRVLSVQEEITLDFRDEPLKNSRVFDYVGVDTQWVTNPSTARRRAQTLSRRMEDIKTKKFPNVTIKKDNYTLFVYGPQDRDILSAGHRSHCCFRPNGNADDQGKDTSLLNYCVSTEYGGGIEIRDNKGQTIMFSPLLRNGNVLMIHSIETEHHNTELLKVVHEMLIQYAEKTLAEAKASGDNLDFVAISNLAYLDESFCKGVLPTDKKFHIYDANNSFNGMYNNLGSTSHHILAFNPEKKISDISYGSAMRSYDYPTFEYNFIYQFSQEELIMMKQIVEIKNNISVLSNKRFDLSPGLTDYQKERYRLWLEIKAYKKKYLDLYKKLISMKPGTNLLEQYKKAVYFINSINEKLNISLDVDMAEVYFGKDWYVIITQDNKVITNYLPTGASYARSTLEKLSKLRPELFPNGRSEDVLEGLKI